MLLNDWRHWLNRLTRSAHWARRAPARGRRRPRLERLEDRLAPAVHDLTTGNTFATIQQAVNAANPADTLLADPGTYAESVMVNKSLTIEGNQHGVDARTGRPGAQESVLDASTNNGQTLFNLSLIHI